jgi:outer membrane murein-binding lipoprotein Lpp
VRVAALLILLLTTGVGLMGCASDRKTIDDATRAAQSWSATIGTITEEWAAARVSLRFTRTTVATAREELRKEADRVRSADAATAARLEQMIHALDPINTALAHNDPPAARAAGASLAALVPPEPSPESPRPAAHIPLAEPTASEVR